MASLWHLWLLGLLARGGALKVLVTGAGGRTGSLVFSALKQQADITPLGLARSNKAVRTLKKAGATEAEIVQADVSDLTSLKAAMEGCDGVVLCTSVSREPSLTHLLGNCAAVPKIRPLSIVKVLFKKAIRSSDPGRPLFNFAPEGTPEEVDWIGAKMQSEVDAAVAAGVKHFVFVSSMGGTQPENFLNTIGRRADGSGGDILLWKRKAERYLMESGLDYTIVHPGGLVDEPDSKRELL
ncbi:MAG: hypothetical protein SGPRY_012511, partial [Prymnesium sp.]